MPHAIDNPPLKNTLNYMAHLRHYGFPSPLIDWTRSPEIAAYFALKNSFHDNIYGSIYVYLESKSVKTGSPDKPYIYNPIQYLNPNPRHDRQGSEYTFCVIDKNGWYYTSHEKAFNLRIPGQDFLWKFLIPSSERLRVLKILDDHNINDYSLFGSEESFMNTMALRLIDFCDSKL